MPTPTQQLFLLLPHHSASPWGSASIQASMTLTLSGFILASRGCLNWPTPALPVLPVPRNRRGFQGFAPCARPAPFRLLLLVWYTLSLGIFYTFVIGVLVRFQRTVRFANPPSYRFIPFVRLNCYIYLDYLLYSQWSFFF